MFENKRRSAPVAKSQMPIEDRVERMKSSSCAQEKEALVRSVATSRKLTEDQLAGVLQEVLEANSSVTNVALGSLYHITLCGERHARRAVETLLDQGCSDDTDMIYAGAIGAMLRLHALSKEDLQVTAEALTGPFAEARRAVVATLASLPAEKVQAMLDTNARNVASRKPGAETLQEVMKRILQETASAA